MTLAASYLLPVCGVRVPLWQSYILGFSLASAVGQNFVYLTITWFNPLVMTTIATTRKFFTIVFSMILYGHAIGPWQWG